MYPDHLIESHRLGGFAHGSIDEMAELLRRYWASRDDQRAIAEACRAYVVAHH